MSLNTGYTPQHKQYDEMGRITPNVEHSESHRPHAEFHIAPWVPVQRYDEALKHWISISLGKVCALDGAGRVVPAGFKKKFNVAAGTTALEYTANDVSAGVINLVTGAKVAAPVTYTEAEVTAALREKGVIGASDKAFDWISKPIGIAPMNMYDAFATDPYNPATYKYHNFMAQHQVSILCDYAITVPHFPAKATAETMNGALDNTTGALDWSSTARVGGWFGSKPLSEIPKYDGVIADGDDIVAYSFEKHPVAKVTQATPISDSEGGLTKEVSSVSNVTAAGEFFIDEDLGLLFLYEAGGNAIPSPFSVSSTVTYFHYEDVVSSSDSRMQSFVVATGDVKFGTFLTFDADSNLIPATLDIGTAVGFDASGNLYSSDPDFDTDADAAISLQIEQAVDNHVFGIVGQVIGEERFPKAYLDRVRTIHEDSTDPTWQLPGSATGGRTDQLSYSHSADKMLIVNLILR